MKIHDTPNQSHTIDACCSTVAYHRSYRTTIPMNFAKLLRLEDGDMIAWDVKIDENTNKPVLMLRKK